MPQEPKYKILFENPIIGKGCISQVYEAVGIHDNKQYCAKLIDYKKDRKKKYLTECEILEECTKKNIYGVVKIFLFYETKKGYVMILEYISGSTNLEKFKERELHKNFIASELIKIVKELHKHSIFHLDIKPRNIVLSKDKVLLIDFDTIIRKEEKSEFLKGTLNYIPPEGLEGIYGSFTDIYCLAWTLVFVFTGKSRYYVYSKYVDTRDFSKVKDFIKRKETHEIMVKEIAALLDESVDIEMKHFILNAMCFDHRERKLG